MLNITMIDYIGFSDESGKPVGHPLKILRDYKELIQDEVQVSIAGPDNYLRKFENNTKIKLPFCTSAQKCDMGILQNAKVFISNMINIFMVFLKCRDDILWFYNINQFLYMYLFLFGNHNKKIIISLYEKEYNKKIYNFFMDKVLKNIALVICTNPRGEVKAKRQIFMPDYFYDEKIFNKYREITKVPRVILAGTINDEIKEIIPLLENYKYVEYPLTVLGKFYHAECYNIAMDIKGDNVSIDNQYLEYDKYIEELGKSKFCILPYNMEKYAAKTSGVLLEAIFMNVIPIAPLEFLENMGIPGVGYKKIADIRYLDFKGIEAESFYVQYKNMISNNYNKEMFQNKLLKSFYEVSEERL